MLIGIGVVGRLLLAFTTDGQRFDLQSYALVNSALHADVFGVYHQLDNFSSPPYGRWPYPPGFFAAIVPIASAAHHLGLAFTSLIRVPAIVCDALIAWLVADHLGRRGHSEVSRLLAAALVTIGPSFVAISAFHGQIDSVAILPAVAAVLLWTRTDARWRAPAAGALIGLGGAIKTVPLLMVLALAPSARSPREALELVLAAGGVALAIVAPWLVFDGPGKSLMWRYRGGPGLGGLSLLAEPSLPLTVFSHGHDMVRGAAQVLYEGSRWITGGALVATAALLVRRRPDPVHAAILIWLAVWVFGVTFFLQYLIWGMPFLLLAGRLRAVIALQALVLAPTILTYATGVQDWQVWTFYTVPMIALWGALAVGLAVLVRRLVRSTPDAMAPVGSAAGAL